MESWEKIIINVRTGLAREFSEHPFRVYGRLFRGENLISVHWTDGPTIEEVEAVTDQYRDAGCTCVLVREEQTERRI